MADGTIALSNKAKETLDQLSAQTGKTIPDLLDQAVESYRRQLFLEAVNVGYARSGPIPRHGLKSSGSAGNGIRR